MTQSVVAYRLPNPGKPDLIFCPDCALNSTKMAFIIAAFAGVVESPPDSMEDAIVHIAAVAAMSGEEFDGPWPLAEYSGECQACGNSLAVSA